MVASDASKGFVTAPRRIAVLRALALGDLLCAVPALRAMRHAWPAAEVALIGLPWAREFVARFPKYLDRFIEFPGWPGLPERQPLVEQIPSFLAAMQREQFDLAIQLHGSGTIVNSLIALLGARQTAGFYPRGYCCPDAITFAPWPEQGLEVDRLLSLVRFLGLETCGDDLELALNDTDFCRLTKVTDLSAAPGRYAVVHAGASVQHRRWPVENFAAVADMLAERGLQIVLTGVASEQAIAQRVAASMLHTPVSLTGETDLGTLGALVAGAEIVVCNDTAISHVAAALHTPSVVISTGDNPARWAPKDQQLHRVLCRARGVTTAEVCREALALLNSTEIAAGKRRSVEFAAT